MTLQPQFRNLMDCIVDAIHSVERWALEPVTGNDKGFIGRHWRSWFGHATVATFFTALGRWAGLHGSFFLPVLGTILPKIAIFALVIYYLLRGRLSDFIVVSFFVYVTHTIPLVNAVLFAALMLYAMYLMARREYDDS